MHHWTIRCGAFHWHCMLVLVWRRTCCGVRKNTTFGSMTGCYRHGWHNKIIRYVKTCTHNSRLGAPGVTVMCGCGEEFDKAPISSCSTQPISAPVPKSFGWNRLTKRTCTNTGQRWPIRPRADPYAACDSAFKRYRIARSVNWLQHQNCFCPKRVHCRCLDGRAAAAQ